MDVGDNQDFICAFTRLLLLSQFPVKRPSFHGLIGQTKTCVDLSNETTANFCLFLPFSAYDSNILFFYCYAGHKVLKGKSLLFNVLQS